MFRKIIPVLLSALMFAGSASAGQLIQVSGPAGAPIYEGFGNTTRNYSPIVKQASYCTRDCTYCRDGCYETYRLNCHEGWCRQSFVLCMRDCWYNICRQC